jgi:hypothetical protein
VFPANGGQVREILNDRYLLAAEGQIDQISHIEIAATDGGALKLRKLIRIEALQPLAR